MLPRDSMDIAAILFPDFALILFGVALRRVFGYPLEFWNGLEKLVYYVLFPALLFNSLAKSRIDFAAAARLIEAGVAFTLIGILLAWFGRRLFAAPPLRFASGFQCAFRFNSYVGFALMERLHGSAGIAAIGLLIGVLVPLVNAAAVWALARHGNGNLLREIGRNPLILSTVGGILYGALGMPLPEIVAHTLGLLGGAALPLGLIAVGAGLMLSGWGESRGLLAYLTAVKLVALPAAALLAGQWLGLSGVYRDTALVTAALPTASSAYILAVRMGGDGKFVASIIAANMVAAMATLPFWLSRIGV